MDELPRDGFSELPIEITQIILSFLSTKEAIQNGLLSKRFLQASSTIPHLDFTFDKFSRNVPNASSFLNSVAHTLTRYQQQSIPIKSFRLYSLVSDDIANILDQCFLKAQQHRVQDISLDLRFYPRHVTSSTRLLRAIFSLEQLLALTLNFCDLLVCFQDDGLINCSPLRFLKLEYVLTDERALQKLLSLCPLVEELHIFYCRELKTIQVPNLPNLKRLHIFADSNQMVYVKAESLELIIYRALSSSHYLLSIGSTRNLKELSLGYRNITENQLLDLIAESHALEKLTLERCNEITKLNVSSLSLTFIRLDCCGKLMKVNIVDVPKLNQFELVGIGIPLLSFPSEDFGNRQFAVALHLYDLKGASSFLKLSEFLMKLKRSYNILLYFDSREINFDISTIDDLRESLPEFEELSISVSSPPSTFSALMDGLLWSFSAKILCVKFDSKNDNFFKYLWKELLVEHDPHNSTGASNVEAERWRNYFKQAKFEGRDDEWRPLYSWKCRADALQNLKEDFILKLSRT